MKRSNESKARVILCGLAILLLLVELTGCGGAKSPSMVVKEFYRLVSAGKYDAASRYLTSDAKVMFALGAGLLEGLKQFVSPEIGSVSISNVEIMSEQISGDNAEVYYILHYSNGSQDPETHEALIKERGRWKIGLGF